LPEEDYYLQDLVEDYNTVFSYVYDYVFERIGELVEHICDGAVDEARREFASLLTDINLKNHGHVDYEQFLANVGAATPSDRQALIEKCLTGIGQAMISMVQKELGQEEKNQLVGELKMFSSSASLNICRQH
jgi:hypothetical protein